MAFSPLATYAVGGASGEASAHTVFDLLERWRCESPAAVAIEDRRRRLTYRDLSGLVERVASRGASEPTSGVHGAPVELEQGLLLHPQVAEAVVVGTPSPLGEEDVVAVIVRDGPHAEDLEASVVDFGVVEKDV